MRIEVVIFRVDFRTAEHFQTIHKSTVPCKMDSGENGELEEGLEINLEHYLSQEKPSKAQQDFNALPLHKKFERISRLVQQSKLYSQIILDDMMEKALEKKQEQMEHKNLEGFEEEGGAREDSSSRPSKDSSAKTSKLSTRTQKKRKMERQPPNQQFSSTAKVSTRTSKAKQAIEAAQTAHSQVQPALLTGCTMKNYQLDGLEWLVSLYENGLNGILADEMGLGKTIQCIALYAYLMENGIKGPFLVVAPLSTVSNWYLEFKRFAPAIKVLRYVGSKTERASLKLSSNINQDVVVTSYEVMIRDHQKFRKINWTYLTVDEGHRLKNFQSVLIQFLKKLDVGNRLLLTGTPLQNNLKELWSLLNFILPNIFHDLEIFESWFDFRELAKEAAGGLEDKEEKMVHEKMQREFIESLHTILKPFILRRVKADVISDLPPKKEYVIYTQLTSLQKIFYQGALEGKLYETVLQFYLKEYLICNYPNEFKSKEDLELVNKVLSEMHNSSQIGETRKRKFQYTDEELDVFKDDNIKSHDQTEESINGYDRDSLTWKDHANNESSNSDSDDTMLSTIEPPLLENRRAIIKSVFRFVEKQVKNFSLQNTMMQLRNICATHYTYYEPFKYEPSQDRVTAQKLGKLIWQHSGKIQMLHELIKRLLKDKHKVLVFSQFTRVLDLIEVQFNTEGIRCSRLDGRMNHEDREKEIHLFSKQSRGSNSVFLLSTRAGGLGLNLVQADTVILFDNDWNPQMDLQAIDRVHRIGQEKPVKIFRFVVRDTVEELLIMKSFGKRALEKMVIESGNFQIGRVAHKLAEENISISALNSAKSMLDLGKRLNLQGECNKLQDINTSDDILLSTFAEKIEKLTDEEIGELMDRSPECYSRSPREYPHVSSFQTINNMDSN